ncbi:MAG: hypothetical protein WC390_10325 [Sulfurimonas sp.]|jgi:hypothetical protein
MNEFKAGQIVVYYPAYERLEFICKVKKVTKNSVTVEPYDNGYCPAYKFDLNGWEKGGGRVWYHLSRIEPLPEGETADSFIKKIEAKVAAQIKERDEKERIRQEKIKDWWESKGKHIWDAKMILPTEFMGHPVYVLRFEDGFESRMPMVIVLDTKDGVEAVSGGLYGSQREGSPDVISTYSSSSVSGRTLEEALYNLIR